MKSFFLFLAFLVVANSAFANCRVDLEIRGFSPAQEEEVKRILASKKFVIAKTKQGNEVDLYVQMYQLENCLPGFSDIYELSGGYQIKSQMLNLTVDRTVTFNRFTFKKRLFQSVKSRLEKIPACR